MTLDISGGIEYLNKVTALLADLNHDLEMLHEMMGGQSGIEIKLDEDKFTERLKQNFKEAVRLSGAANTLI